MTSRTWALALAFGAAGLLACGCSSDDTTANPQTVTILPEAGTGGSNAGGSGGGGGANTGGTDASVTGGNNNTGGSDAALYEAGPDVNPNVCDPASGSYDNSALPLTADGGLPPL